MKTNKPNQVILTSSKLIRSLSFIALLLILASIGGQISKYLLGHGYLFGLVQFLNVDKEQNLPTAFSAFLLLFSAALLFLLSIIKKNSKDLYYFRWKLLSYGFLFIAFDEAFVIHERITIPLRNLFGDVNLGFFYFAWVIPYILILLVVFILFYRFFFHLPKTTRFTFFISACFYVGGAVGFEFIEGQYAELNGMDNMVFSIMTTIEESLEMAGVILFIRGLLDYIAIQYHEVQMVFILPNKNNLND